MVKLTLKNWVFSFLYRLVTIQWTVFGSTIYQEADPNIQYACKGELGEHPSCSCNEADSEITCINAQFFNSEVFRNVPTYYKGISRITFHGNNFQMGLPDGPLFGDNVVMDAVTVLNISADYIVNLNSNSLKGLPNLRVLDLSNNEIVLKPEDVHFLAHTPKITHLYLRRAFTSLVNRTIQFDLMLKMFYNGRLDKLQYIDLSFNYFTSVPFNLPCPFPGISMIDLRQNLLLSVAMNATCLHNIETIDLSRNHFNYLDENFREKFANHLPANSLLMRNAFHCDCNSAAYIGWIRSTNTIREKNLLTCSRASPPNFIGARLVEVPVHKLDCKTSLTANQATGQHFIDSGANLLCLLVLYMILR